MSLDIDYYELLEVERNADDKTLKSAYRKLAMQYHPDKNPGCSDSEARFKAINEAYDCLKDPQKRAAYDRFGHAAFQQGGFGQAGRGPGGGGDFGDIGDIFETIFGSAFGGGGGRARPRRGADLRYDMEISLDDAFHGKETQIEVEVSTQCEACEGSGAQPGTGTRGCGPGVRWPICCRTSRGAGSRCRSNTACCTRGATGSTTASRAGRASTTTTRGTIRSR